MTDLAVNMRGICKSFSGVRVLDSVDFELRAGEIHALVGGNGAGKSTLMKILVGVYALDEGTFEVGGREVHFSSSHDARDAGVGMVFQEFSLIPQLTVAQNIYLTREPTSAGLISDAEMVRRSTEIFETMKVDIDPRKAIEDLPTAYWQLTEIAKALSQNARVLIFDEPTTALAKTETQDLFELMRRLKDQGMSIVYISHRMEEVFEISDRITVLRDGSIAMTRDAAELTMVDVIGAIVGRTMEHAMEWEEREVGDEIVLEARKLNVGDRLRDVDLYLRRGEVLGLAGLMGSGRTELARALFGIDHVDSGDVLLNGKERSLKSPGSAIDAGIALIPEDRRVQGLVLDHGVRDNIVLPLLDRISRAGFVDDGKGDASATEAVSRLGHRHSLDQTSGEGVVGR